MLFDKAADWFSFIARKDYNEIAYSGNYFDKFVLRIEK